MLPLRKFDSQLKCNFVKFRNLEGNLRESLICESYIFTFINLTFFIIFIVVINYNHMSPPMNLNSVETFPHFLLIGRNCPDVTFY